jgi:hypothetical protein
MSSDMNAVKNHDGSIIPWALTLKYIRMCFLLLQRTICNARYIAMPQTAHTQVKWISLSLKNDNSWGIPCIEEIVLLA